MEITRHTIRVIAYCHADEISIFLSFYFFFFFFINDFYIAFQLAYKLAYNTKALIHSFNE